MGTTIYSGGLIFDGDRLLENHSAVFIDGVCTAILPYKKLDGNASEVELAGDILSVGYADLQVNGGGGKLLNNETSVDTLISIARAHRSLGTTCLLPTLITDTFEVTESAIAAAIALTTSEPDGPIAGLHLEGPHLSVAKKGAHDANLIRPMQQNDLAQLLQAAENLPVLKVTLAPESVTIRQVESLTEAGVLVALGHTAANYDTCMAYHQAGASCVTHLFNAMSQLGSREPGLVGAALDADELSVGLIVDGVHVHAAAIRTAWMIKARTQHCYLVTDAMTSAGTTLGSFELNGRTIRRRNGSLTLDDGTLAGADIDLTSSIRYLCNEVGIELSDALRAAVEVPRRILGMDKSAARIMGKSAGDVIRIGAELDEVSYLEDIAEGA